MVAETRDSASGPAEHSRQRIALVRMPHRGGAAEAKSGGDDSGSETASTPNAADRTVSLRPALHVDHPQPVSLALRAPVARRPAFEMPWIWRVLRREVYRRLPRHEDPHFTLSLAPVVVDGTFDTVPGVGVAGDF